MKESTFATIVQAIGWMAAAAGILGTSAALATRDEPRMSQYVIKDVRMHCNARDNILIDIGNQQYCVERGKTSAEKRPYSECKCDTSYSK